MANIGQNMAAAVDAEIASFRQIQEEIQKLRVNQQTLMQQQSENEMVKQELAILDDSTQVFKMVGPILIKNSTDDAKQTVEQRLQLISGELKKVEKSIKEKEEKGTDIANKVREMQSAMQSAAVEAAKATAAQAAQG